MPSLYSPPTLATNSVWRKYHRQLSAADENNNITISDSAQYVSGRDKILGSNFICCQVGRLDVTPVSSVVISTLELNTIRRQRLVVTRNFNHKLRPSCFKLLIFT